MSGKALEGALAELKEIQRRTVEWREGPLLVLAGPGSGKTKVLTCRIAQLLDASAGQNFRIMALTFTNKAADEMRQRVALLVPGLEERALIGTFHSFCTQVLRQHGAHLGLKSDFAIYSAESDRRAVLKDALTLAQKEGLDLEEDESIYLYGIERLQSRLVEPERISEELPAAAQVRSMQRVYQLYDQVLQRINALDFPSLLMATYRLATRFPALAARFRKTYPYWLVDEFQDTNQAQYRVVRSFLGEGFREIFAVADDDQIIYGWNGASFAQIQSYLSDFSAQVVQLPTNFRCPAAVVEAANRLVVYNTERSATKKPLLAGKQVLKFPPSEHIRVKVFERDEHEAAEIAKEIGGRGEVSWGETAILARNRSLLEVMQAALQAAKVRCIVAQRRDDFLSPHFRWVVATLRQVARPLDRHNLGILVEAFNRCSGTSVEAGNVVDRSEATGEGYLASWYRLLGEAQPQGAAAEILEIIAPALGNASAIRVAMDKVIARWATCASDGTDTDLSEDLAAWRGLLADIGLHSGEEVPLDQFLQELSIRSKEPMPKPNTVTLTTIHGAKGREFDWVYVIGMVEDVMPSFQSKKRGDQSAEMEEERRSCFVAITRTKECLVLSRAKVYTDKFGREWRREPSRFLVEMGWGNMEIADVAP